VSRSQRTASCWASGPEWWHPNPESFYKPGCRSASSTGAVLPDRRSCTCSGRHARFGLGQDRHRRSGASLERAESAMSCRPRRRPHVSSMIDFVSGASATLVTSFDVKADAVQDHRGLRDEGRWRCPDPNTFGWPAEGAQHHRRRLARDTSAARPTSRSSAASGWQTCCRQTAQIVRIGRRPNWRCTCSS
jgi:hypothetical protein